MQNSTSTPSTALQPSILIHLTCYSLLLEHPSCLQWASLAHRRENNLNPHHFWPPGTPQPSTWFLPSSVLLLFLVFTFEGCSGCLSPPLSSSPPVPFTVQQFSSAVWSSDLDTVFFLLVLVDTLIFSLPLWKLTEHLLSKPILISSGSGRGSRPRRLWELSGCLVSAFRLHQLENDRGSHSCTVSTSPWLCHGDWIFNPSLLSWQPEVKEHRCFTVWQLLLWTWVNEVEKKIICCSFNYLEVVQTVAENYMN